MKPVFLLLGISAAVNLGLLAAFTLKPELAPNSVRNFLPQDPAATETNAAVRSRNRVAAEARNSGKNKLEAVDAAKPGQLWSALDSEDLPTLVNRLRAAGFSRPVVLAILNARFDVRFADRLKALTGDIENTPFWKPDPMSGPGNSKYWEEYSQLHRERSRLLRELLGDDSLAYAGTDPATVQRRQFGNIPKEKIDLIQRINDDYAEMTSQIRAATQGITLPEDREKFALLEREKRTDLAGILTASELEEYEMRSSPVTSRLRAALSIMDASEEEFRAIFKIQQSFNEQLNPMVMVFGDMMESRREAQKKMYEQLKATLPTARYHEYVRASNSEYQQLYRIAQRENIPTETAIRAFSIRDDIAAESGRIADNPTLTSEQKSSALTALAQKGRTQILSTLGPGAGEAYAQTARWLTTIERGAAVAFGPDGNVMPRPVATPPKP